MPSAAVFQQPVSRGEVWLVNLDLTIGQEIKKTRPAVVVSSNSIGKLPLKIIVPITDWKPPYANYPWMVYLEPNKQNGLSKKSGADTFRVRSVDQSRLVKKLECGGQMRAKSDSGNGSLAPVWRAFSVRQLLTPDMPAYRHRFNKPPLLRQPTKSIGATDRYRRSTRPGST